MPSASHTGLSPGTIRKPDTSLPAATAMPMVAPKLADATARFHRGTWKHAHRALAVSCSSGSVAGPGPGSGPGGKSGSWPRRSTMSCAFPAFPVHRRPAGTKTTDSVRRHLAEYLGEAGDRVPWWLGLGLRMAPSDQNGRNGLPGRRGSPRA